MLHALVSPNSYGLVLLLIVVTYIVSVSTGEQPGTSIMLFLQVATVWLALRTSHARRTVRIAADFVLGAAVVIAVISLFLHDDSSPPAFVFITSCLLYVIAPFSIVRHLAARRVVDLETMLGAVAAYLLFGMTFALIYRSIGAVQSQPFFGPNGDGTISQDLFFSFTTLTTTGYGNLVPATNPGQSLAVLEMIVGQLFLITAVGKIVASWTPRARSRGTDDPAVP